VFRMIYTIALGQTSSLALSLSLAASPRGLITTVTGEHQLIQFQNERDKNTLNKKDSWKRRRLAMAKS